MRPMSNTEHWKNWVSREVDRKFPLRQWVGGSDHSAVFLSELPGPGARNVAIKLIDIEGEDANRRLRQLRAGSKVSHPHLLQIIEAGKGELDGTPFLYVLMEYADEDLSQILPQRPLSPDEVSDLLPPVLDALSSLHSHGFVHGRIKPSNLFAVGEQLKLSSDQITAINDQYLQKKRRDVFDAPERAAGEISAASDVWSVGATLFATMTQHAPAENSPGNVTLTDAIPEPYRGIARQCLQPDPKQRCSLSEIGARLLPAGRSVPHQPEPLPVPLRSVNHRPSLAGVIVAIVAILVLVGVFLSRGKNSSTQNSDATPKPAAQATLPTSPTQEPVQAPKTASSEGDVVQKVMPDVPQSAKNTITGTIKVTVRAEVDSSGKVTSAKFKSAGASRYFADKAIEAARRWQFSPPLVEGQPTASTWLLHFHFRRTSFQASAERTKR